MCGSKSLNALLRNGTVDFGFPNKTVRKACPDRARQASGMEKHPAPGVRADFKVVVDTPGWHKVRPRIPDTPQRRTLAKQRSIRELVFGVQDGILTTLGIATGVGAAEGKNWLVVLSGLLALLAGALSMGVGEYLGGKSEREVVQATIEMERQEMSDNPQDEFAEQVAYYKLKGFSSDEAHMIVTRLTQNPEIYLYEMMRDEFGVDPRVAEETSLQPAFAMAGSFAVGALLPLIPYFFNLGAWWTLGISLVLAVAGLFAVGYYAGTLTNRANWHKALEIVAYGAIVFAVSWAAGWALPHIFGHPGVNLGAG